MKGDLPAAALACMARCPVRTHERTYKPYAGTAGPKESKALIIDGKHFSSIIEVKRHFHVCTKTVQNWINSGKAVRA